ncbi:hypothetical protein EU524_00180 [Candidatus Thorarchaeota archaeon]|nr:MAG: hypothetical protein EU524_00180 [Candidatus Thorarchaeota archaeon]
MSQHDVRKAKQRLPGYRAFGSLAPVEGPYGLDLSSDFTSSLETWRLAIAVGLIPVLIGVYFLWKWYKSGA